MYFACSTRIGPFFIVPKPRGWYVMHDNDLLDGPFRTPQHAVDDLAGGHTPWPSSGVDPSTLGIPDDIGDWQRAR